MQSIRHFPKVILGAYVPVTYMKLRPAPRWKRFWLLFFSSFILTAAGGSVILQRQSAILPDLSPDESILTQAAEKVNFPINLPLLLSENLTLEKNLEVRGKAVFKKDITAGNILYGLSAGTGLSVSGGQSPTITNTGVLSLQNKNGQLSLEAGSGIAIDGLKISASGSTAPESGWKVSSGVVKLAEDRNVGIGTATPLAKLEVAGDLKLTDSRFQGDIFTRLNSNLDRTWNEAADFNASGTSFSAGLQNPAQSDLRLLETSPDSPLPGWIYYQRITLNNPSGQVLDNYAVAVTLDTQALISQGKLQAGCEDLRFTDENGRDLLPYWIESGCGTISTNLWVKVAAISGVSKEIYVYYGNTVAPAASSGPSTFLLFDDFNDDSLNSDLWTASVGGTGIFSESGGNAVLHTGAGLSSNAEILGKSRFGPNVAMRFRANLSAYQNYDHKVMGFLDGNIGYSPPSANGVYFRGEDNNFQTQTSISTGATPSVPLNFYNFSYPTYSLWDIKWLASAVTFFRNGSLFSTHASRIPGSTLPHFGLNTHSLFTPGAALDMNLDWVFIRQYVDSEPAVSAFGEEYHFTSNFAAGKQTWLSEILDAGENKNYKPNKFLAGWNLDASDDLPPKFQILASAAGAFAGEETVFPSTGAYYEDGGAYDLQSGEEKDLSGQIGSFFRFWRIKAVINTGANLSDTPAVASLRLRDDYHYSLNLQPYGQKVGIGTTNPTAVLDIAGDASSSGSLVLRNLSPSLDILNGQGFDIQTSPGGDAGLVSRLKITSGGNVGIGTAAPGSRLSVSGLSESAGTNLVIDGNGNIFKASSSERYKENIENFSPDWTKILSLRPVFFQYRATGVKDIGYLAEDLDREELDDLVIYDKEGRPEAIKYDRISLYLIEAIKSLKINFSSQEAGFGQIKVTGLSNLGDLAVTGKLTAGLLVIDGLNSPNPGASISTLAGPLRLQAGSLGNIEMMEGKLIVDTAGNLTTQGTLAAKEIRAEKFSVGSGGGPMSLGEGIIKAGGTGASVFSSLVTEKSAIFLTAKEIPLPLAVTTIIPGQSFTIATDKSYSQDIKFNWWIIN